MQSASIESSNSRNYNVEIYIFLKGRLSFSNTFYEKKKYKCEENTKTGW